jgi:hypothetical protein
MARSKRQRRRIKRLEARVDELHHVLGLVVDDVAGIRLRMTRMGEAAAADVLSVWRRVDLES